MMKRSLLIIAILALNLGLAGAEFDVRDSSSYIDEGPYYLGDFVEGRINISFSDQSNSDFESDFYGGVELLKVLEENGYSREGGFYCNPASCQSDYVANFGSLVKTDISFLDKKIYGFRIKENRMLDEILDLEFKVDIYSNPSCDNQLYIDLFDDGVYDFYNDQSIPGCPSDYHYGCFDPSEVTRDVLIGDDPYCELIELPPAPGYELGARVKKNFGSGSDPGSLRFAIWDFEERAYVVYDDVQDPDENAFILVNYSYAEKTEVFVCVDTPRVHKGKYSIDINENEDPEDMCGFSTSSGNFDQEEFDRDYEIYAKPLGYAPMTDITFGDAIYDQINGGDLEDDLDEYINQTYHYNCSGEEGCIIPFAIWGKGGSYVDGMQGIHSAEVLYKVGGDLESEVSIYEVGETPAKLSSEGYLFLDVIDMEFEVPDSDGEHTFNLGLGGEEIISEEINVDVGFEFNVGPRFGFVGRSTSFTAITNVNVTSSIWEFGDGSLSVHSNDKTAQHTYSTDGNYIVKVTLIRPERGSIPASNSTRRFKMVVGDAITSVNLTIREYESRIANMQSDLSGFPAWTRGNISSAFGLEGLRTLVAQKKTAFNALNSDPATVNESYISLINELMTLNVPYSIFESQSSVPLPILIGYENMNLEHIKEISGSGDGVDSEEIMSNIINWMNSNYEATAEFKTISALGDIEKFDILRIYKINLIRKPDAESGTSYLVISQPFGSVVFQVPAGSESVSGGSGTYRAINGTSTSRVIEFLMAGQNAPDIENLGAYISPVLSGLDISDKPIREAWWEDEGGHFNWNRFLLGMAILLTIALSVYIILQAWYKRYYEKHLFSNPNDLYNLINFAYNSRKSGLKDEEIKNKLKEMGWKSEQVDYTLKKMDGKRTGMWEIPIFKFIENKKVKNELRKKQGGKRVDARFIKRPVY